MNYKPTIGLEIHVELKTKTKMFCSCFNDADEKHPNVNICPVCLGHPGTLPTINKKAVEAVLKLGMALGGEIPKKSKFDRKNYFYPDLPKGYQISQYDQPLVIGGELDGIKLRRIHLEEDTARLVHSPDGKSSLVDFNRAGVPLMELVTEPDVKSGEEAVNFAKELRLILRYLDISDADMERGQMRVEANVSVSRDDELGTKVEIKNINSFKAVFEAINYEIKRQTESLESGEEVRQETRGWDDLNKKTISQRLKEEAHDYRYFPEPDLPPLDIPAAFDLGSVKLSVPELPREKRLRFIKQYSLLPGQIEILIQDTETARYFEEAASELSAFLPAADFNLLYNYFTSDLWGLMKKTEATFRELKVSPERFAHLVALLIRSEVSSRTAKDVLAEMFKTGLDPETIVKKKNLGRIFDGNQIEKAIKETIDENLAAASDYRKGKQNALEFLVGKAMAKIKGRADPQTLREIFNKKLKNEP